MDITDLPSEFNIDNIYINDHINSKLACIVDNLSKFAYAEIIPNKKAINVLPVLMRYINLKGKPDILLTDNGTEFCNHIFSDYLDNLKKRIYQFLIIIKIEKKILKNQILYYQNKKY